MDDGADGINGAVDNGEVIIMEDDVPLSDGPGVIGNALPESDQSQNQLQIEELNIEEVSAQTEREAKTREQLENELASVVLTGNRAEDVVTTAKAHVGCREDNREFVSAVLWRAQIGEMPEMTDAKGSYISYADWVMEIREAGLYMDISNIPQAGDLVFLDWEEDQKALAREDERIDRMGIVVNVRTREGNSGTRIVQDIMILTENTNGLIESFFYNMQDAANAGMIAGYAKLPEDAKDEAKGTEPAEIPEELDITIEDGQVPAGIAENGDGGQNPGAVIEAQTEQESETAASPETEVKSGKKKAEEETAAETENKSAKSKKKSKKKAETAEKSEKKEEDGKGEAEPEKKEPESETSKSEKKQKTKAEDGKAADQPETEAAAKSEENGLENEVSNSESEAVKAESKTAELESEVKNEAAEPESEIAAVESKSENAESESEAESEDAQTESAIESESESEPESEIAEPESEIKSETTEPESEAESEAEDSETEPESEVTEPGTESGNEDAQTEPAAENESETETIEAEPEKETADSETEPESEIAKPGTELESEITDSEIEPESEAAEPESEPESETAESATESESEITDSETEPESGTAEPGTELESEITDSETEPESEIADSGTESERGNADSETESENDPAGEPSEGEDAQTESTLENGPEPESETAVTETESEIAETESESEPESESENETEDWNREEFESETDGWDLEDESESETEDWNWEEFENETEDWNWEEFESETEDWNWEEFENETEDWNWEEFESETDGWDLEDEPQSEMTDWSWEDESESEWEEWPAEDETELETEMIPEVGDPAADLETSEDWEASVADVALTGVWADDLTAIAETQLGVKESTKNFETAEDGTRKGITRYGQWYGEPYGDWNAMFVSWCLNYAEIPHESVPRSGKCESLTELLQVYGLYENADEYEPSKGDLVFLDTDGDENADHVGITEAVTEIGIGGINVIAGDLNDEVKSMAYAKGDAALAGYGRLPQKPAQKLVHRTYKGDDVIITAEYTAEAGIPDQAQFIAEEVPQGDERYEEHRQTVQEMIGAGLDRSAAAAADGGNEAGSGDMIIADLSGTGSAETEAYDIEETALEAGGSGAEVSGGFADADSESGMIDLTGESLEAPQAEGGTTEEKDLHMRVYNIGFYLDEQEIEPQAEVKVSIEFLDDPEFSEGANAVIHMEDGKEPETLAVTNAAEEEGGQKKIEFSTKSF